jgi:phage tail-like protein
VRGTIDGLPNAQPLGDRLPARMRDESALRFTAGLDSVLAPVLTTLDCLSAYLDPRLAPADFVAWLAGWVGLAVADGTPPERVRELVRRAPDLHRLRGTADGLGAHVWLVTGCRVEVRDSGGCVGSTRPGTPLPGRAEPGVHVRVTTPPGVVVDTDWLDAFVAAAKPAHLPHSVEVVAADRPDDQPTTGTPSEASTPA